MPPPPRNRAPHLLPVQSHLRPQQQQQQQQQQTPTSNPGFANQQLPPNYPYQSFLAQQQYSPSTPASTAGHSPLLEYYQQPLPEQQIPYRASQSHYNIPGPNSPIDGSNNPFTNPNLQSPTRRQERFEAEARQQQYRLQHDDGDSVIDYYNHNTADERGIGGGFSANPSPIDFPQGQGQHNLLWLHQQQKISQQIAAAQQRELELQLQQQGIADEYQFQEFPLDTHHHQYYIPQHQQYHHQQQQQQQLQQQLQQQPQDYRLHTSHSSQPPATPTSTTLSGTTGSVRESVFPPGLERELSYLSVEDRGTGSPRAQGFGFNSSEAVERVIDQPHYPKVPKLTSSPVTFTFNQAAASPSGSVTATSTSKFSAPPPIVHTPPPKIPSKIHPNAPNPAASPPSLPPPPSSTGYDQAVQQYRQPQIHDFTSSPQVEAAEQAHSGSETESEVGSNSSADEEDEEEDMSTSDSPATWISSFCSLQGHEYFAEVSEDFIEDDFNLTGLSSLVPLYKECLEMILDVEPDDEEEEPSEEDVDEDDSQHGGPVQKRRGERTQADMETLESQAELLYGLIHQRFITSRQGMQIMYDKYQNNHFGYCPRVFCNATKVLPCGYSDTPGVETVKLYCPSCMDMYVPPNSRFQTVDGAFFGTTFPTLFFLTFPDIEVSTHQINAASNTRELAGYKPSPSQLKKQKADADAGVQRPINGVLENNLAPGLGKGKTYEMKIYGFRVSERAKGGPRMKWLRSRPEDVSVLDEFTRAQGEGWLSAEEGEEEAKAEKKSGVRRSARRRA